MGQSSNKYLTLLTFTVKNRKILWNLTGFWICLSLELCLKQKIFSVILLSQCLIVKKVEEIRLCFIVCKIFKLFFLTQINNQLFINELICVVKVKMVLKDSSWLRKPSPAGIYLLKVNNRNTRTRCKICSKLTIQTPKWHHWHLYFVFIVKNL